MNHLECALFRVSHKWTILSVNSLVYTFPKTLAKWSNFRNGNLTQYLTKMFYCETREKGGDFVENLLRITSENFKQFCLGLKHQTLGLLHNLPFPVTNSISLRVLLTGVATSWRNLVKFRLHVQQEEALSSF